MLLMFVWFVTFVFAGLSVLRVCFDVYDEQESLWQRLFQLMAQAELLRRIAEFENRSELPRPHPLEDYTVTVGGIELSAANIQFPPRKIHYWQEAKGYYALFRSWRVNVDAATIVTLRVTYHNWKHRNTPAVFFQDVPISATIGGENTRKGA